MKWNMLKSVLENVMWKHKSTVICNPITLILFSFFLLLVYAYIVYYALYVSFSWHKQNLATHKHYIRKIQENHEKLELSWKQIFVYADDVHLYNFNTQTTKKNKFYQILCKEAGLKVKLVLYMFLSCHWHVTTQRWLKNPSKL